VRCPNSRFRPSAGKTEKRGKAGALLVALKIKMVEFSPWIKENFSNPATNAMDGSILR
jgi:hypothetical protein